MTPRFAGTRIADMTPSASFPALGASAFDALQTLIAFDPEALKMRD